MLPQWKIGHPSFGDTGSGACQKKREDLEKMKLDGKNTYGAEIENKLQGTL